MNKWDFMMILVYVVKRLVLTIFSLALFLIIFSNLILYLGSGHRD